MQIICLEEAAFYELVEQVVGRLKDQYKQQDKWVDQEEAMRLLNIKSKSTLQHLRDTLAITYSQPNRKIIVYDRASILAYLDKHAKKHL